MSSRPLRSNVLVLRNPVANTDTGTLHVIQGTQPRTAAPDRPPLGKILVENGDLTPDNLLKALAMQARQDASLGDILLAHGWVTQENLMSALGQQLQTRVIDPTIEPPDPRLLDHLTADRCLREALLPWRRLGSVTVVLSARPHIFERYHEELTERFGPVVMALATEAQIYDAVEKLRAPQLTRRAETLVNERFSCRSYLTRGRLRFALAGVLTLAAAAFAFPQSALALLTGWAIFSLVMQFTLKATASVIALRRIRHERQIRKAKRIEALTIAQIAASGATERYGVVRKLPSRRPAIARLPVVSVMVPLFREEDITSRLIQRLSRLTYPKELLDVVLVMEAIDGTTHNTLRNSDLPPWLRVVTVPPGTVQTKPRALNYALQFCRGTIVGVWDAEDAPEPEQIHKVVRRFHELPPEVVCLQGALDFYNARTNWLARCFAVEYSGWFRVVLPALSALGLPIPLGGTTLFFRREPLEELGGWDAHNVTEDADLGMRLARQGYRTEMVDSTTYEEANCRAIPWIKQRSRWLKGYALTWAVHMRSPRRLLKDLGAWQFAGFQLVFLGALTQFILAPILWSFWIVPFGLSHPVADTMPIWLFWGLVGTFLASEASSIATGIIGTRFARHFSLQKWVPSLYFYYPLATFASYKALYEIFTKPFYWDKTAHGIHHEAEQQVQ